MPYAISDVSEAIVQCNRSTLAKPPGGGTCTRFHRYQVIEALPPRRRFRVAQDWPVAGHVRPPAGIGSKEALQPPAPCPVAPALLEARD